MEKLFSGVLQFQREDFVAHRELFGRLGREQKPHTLFIGCSDSRVVPSLITQTAPGELFIVRNVANIVPPYRETEEWVATTAAIEFAVQVLGVETIVVCGHSNCGGCAALHSSPEELAHIPHVRRWLEICREAPGQVAALAQEGSAEEREWLTEQLNVVLQMRNLLTFPYIRERVESGRLLVLGWHYLIETGEVYNFNDTTGRFEPITG